jgi:acyl-CoA dehydrogenase
MKLSFLRPSPHGGIVLKDCAVPSANILGKKGSAYADIIIPFGELEVILSMGPIVGGMKRELELLVNAIREQRIRANDELKNGLGELKYLADTLDIMAYEAANMLDSDTSHPELYSVPLCSRNMAIRFQSQLDVIMSQANIKSDMELSLLANDLDHLVNMGKNTVVIKQRKLGESVLSGKAYNNESA